MKPRILQKAKNDRGTKQHKKAWLRTTRYTFSFSETLYTFELKFWKHIVIEEATECSLDDGDYSKNAMLNNRYDTFSCWYSSSSSTDPVSEPMLSIQRCYQPRT